MEISKGARTRGYLRAFGIRFLVIRIETRLAFGQRFIDLVHRRRAMPVEISIGVHEMIARGLQRIHGRVNFRMMLIERDRRGVSRRNCVDRHPAGQTQSQYSNNCCCANANHRRLLLRVSNLVLYFRLQRAT